MFAIFVLYSLPYTFLIKMLEFLHDSNMGVK